MKKTFVALFVTVLLFGCQGTQIEEHSQHPPHPEFDPSEGLNLPQLPISTQAHNDAFIYRLPWTKSAGYPVTQGSFTNSSHMNMYAWDFGMPNGTTLLAARSGTVVRVAEGRDWGTTCGNPEKGSCYNGNFVAVRHDDQSVGYYLHMTKGSIAVGEGASVNVGTKLGLSGQTGYTCGATCTVPGPHLHFEVQSNGMGSTTSPVKFKEVIDSGRADGIAVFGATYYSQNDGTTTPPTPCNPVPGPFTHEISDNSGAFHTGGLYPQYWWQDGSNGSNSSSTFSYTVTGSQENYAWWDVNVLSTGLYDVYAFIPVGNGGSGLAGYPTQKAIGASYNLEVAGGSPRLANVQINQEGVCGWVKLFSGKSLTAGQAYAVSMGDSVGASNPVNRRIYYDNIALIKTGTPPDPNTYPPAPCADPNLTVGAWDENEFSRQGLYPQYWYTEGSNGGGGRSTFTYTVNGADQNFATWNLRTTVAGKYDVWVFTPTPTEDTRPLGSYGNQIVADGATYRFYNGGGGLVAERGGISQTRGCWQRMMTDLTLNGGETYKMRLGDSVSGAADRKLYFDTVGLRLTQEFKPAWSVNPGALTFNGIVGADIPDQNVIITNSGTGAGTFASGSSNDAVFGANGFVLSLNPGASTTAKFIVAKCTAVGTTTGQISFQGAGSTANVALTRVCSPRPEPIWSVNTSSLTLPAGVVGGLTTTGEFTLSNSGNAAGGFTASSNNAAVTLAPSTGSVGIGGAQTITVTAAACTSASAQNATIAVAGQTVNVTRTCTVAPPTAPGISSITMSSNGRIFIAWPEVSGATQYDFQATFGGAAISVTGQAPNRGGVNGSAVATFLSAPDAADKQGKQVCFSMRASNTGGPSAFSSFACTTYKYYAGGLSVQSSSDVPRLTLK
jgi:murein DD-endopeptidase MepM/ murein hydrolase activator NlpD